MPVSLAADKRVRLNLGRSSATCVVANSAPNRSDFTSRSVCRNGASTMISCLHISDDWNQRNQTWWRLVVSPLFVIVIGIIICIKNYSSNLLPLEYSLISISRWKFPFPVADFAVSWWTVGIYEKLGFSLSFAICQPGNRGACSRPWPFGLQVR